MIGNLRARIQFIMRLSERVFEHHAMNVDEFSVYQTGQDGGSRMLSERGIKAVTAWSRAKHEGCICCLSTFKQRMQSCDVFIGLWAGDS